jgi:hypothetical protein
MTVQEDPTSRIPGAYHWEVVVQNRSNGEYPVDLLLVFEGGKTERRDWDGKGEVWCISGQGPDKLLFASVDPEEKYALDTNRINNRRSVRFDNEGVFFLAGWLHFWIQNYLNGWAFFG